MIKIGELSKITNTSVKTIRFYEEEGLISPVEVDRWTGYRYYDDNSINRLSEIAYLKDLGFTLKEIRNMDEKVIKNKLNELKIKLKKITNNIKTLSSLKEGEDIIMKNFVNDPQVIGKWQKVGVVARVEDFKLGKLKKDDDCFKPFKELYFLPNGEPYWSLSWSKNKLFVDNKMHEYKIIDGMLFVFVKDKYSNSIDDIVVYKQLDKKAYALKDIRIVDDINLPFINDNRVLGIWDVVWVTRDQNPFSNEKLDTKKENLMLQRLIFDKDGKLTWISNKGFAATWHKWTKDYMICPDPTHTVVSKYVIEEKGGDMYLSMEWKSGNYIYGGIVNTYYVFKKVK